MGDKTDQFCATAAQSAMVGMVISGRAAKACDVCGKERARWYCTADLAYLCERCDVAVHSANPVAGRHERARLGPNGALAKKSQTPVAVDVKRDASAVVSPPHPSAHFNPRKRPRSIRRHKPSSLYASKHFTSSSIHTSSKHNHVSSHASIYNNYTGSILASTHGVMIDNPRRSPDFIANISSNELLTKTITSTVKAEPYSPVDIGDQVKVPDHLDDDHLLECLFDFRDLHDDDLFLHQVPIYDSRQDLSPALNHSAQGADGGQDYEEAKPIIRITSPFSASRENNQCANFHSPELCRVEEGEGVSLAGGSTEVTDDAPPASLAECKNGTDKNTIDLNNEICDLDQLDFDCVLQGNDDESTDEMDHSASMDIDLDMDVDMTSHDFIDVYPEHATTETSGYTEVSFNHHGSCKSNDSDGSHDGEHHHVSGFDFNAAGGESPRTWLSKVKVEELEFMRDQHGTDVCDDATLLREKLTCNKAFSADSPPSAFKLGLKLNFEDVVSSWSDRGTFWTDGYRPSQVANCLDFLGGCFVTDMNGTGGTQGEGQQMVSVLNHKNKLSDAAREASVLRYREKRLTRLFSKKIRYEVRKLNAEKRPRMKGRFVKRMPI